MEFCWIETILFSIYNLCFQEAADDTPITYKMSYNWFWRIGANWSTTSKKSDRSVEYPVVRYTEYASSLEKFAEKYPYFTVETYGRAESQETFGAPCNGHFGTRRFETINFILSNGTYRDLSICSSHLNHSAFDVGVEIGLGVKYDAEKLYLRPQCNGWIYSVGMKWRYLNFGLGVTSITFHPRSDLNRVDLF